MSEQKKTSPQAVFRADQEVLYPLSCITPRQSGKQWSIENQVGQQILLDAPEWSLWQRINGKDTCEQILNRHLQDFPDTQRSDLRESLERWVKHYCVGWLLRRPAPVNG